MHYLPWFMMMVQFIEQEKHSLFVRSSINGKKRESQLIQSLMFLITTCYRTDYFLNLIVVGRVSHALSD